MKIVECLLFRDESDLLATRLSYLQGTVSHTYVFESALTYRGNPKPLQKEELLRRFGHHNISIIEIPIPKQVKDLGNPWAIEEYSRDWATQYVAHRHPEDAIVLCDIDEIPSVEQLNNARETLEQVKFLSLPMDTLYRHTSLKAKHSWDKGRVFLGKHAEGGIRYRLCKPVKGNKGVHFRYMGWSSRVTDEKLAAFSHSELDIPKDQVSLWVRFADNFGISHIPSFSPPGFGLLEVEREPSNLVQSFREISGEKTEQWDFESKSWSSRLAASHFLGDHYGDSAKIFGKHTSELSAFLDAFSATELLQALFRFALEQSRLPRITRVLNRVVGDILTKRPPGRKWWHVIHGVYAFGDLTRIVVVQAEIIESSLDESNKTQ